LICKLRNEIEKRGDIYWDLPNIRYDIVHLASARYKVSFSIHKPISDRVSMLLPKLVQTDCRLTFRELNRRLRRLLPWCWVVYLFKVNSLV